jgi:Transposase DDE domain
MKITFLNYLAPLLVKLKQKQVKANLITLAQRVIREKSIQMWRLSETKNEYNNFHNLVNGQLKNTVDVEKINQSLLVHQVAKQSGKPTLSLIYDGSDLRKEESEKLENLGWVKSLSGQWIRGYSSFNSIVLDRKNGAVGLLSSIPYSNRDPQFLSEKERKLFEKNKIEDPERHQAIEKYLEAEDAYNQKTIYFSSIRTNHDHFKAQNPSVELTHILDRGHDDASLFELIDGELHDKFVIRMKGSRNSTVQAFNETKQKEMFVKMGVVSFAHRAEKTYEKVHFNKKVYVKPHAIFEWDTICIHNCTYNIVRVRFFDCKGVPIFKEPMLIITNHEVKDVITAQFVYQLYLQRSKIEGVFKFLKEVLGWETFRVHDFESIKNLIALCFFIGAYFYEIQDELTQDANIQWICELAGSKGKVTRFFLLKGLEILLHAQRFEAFQNERNLSKEQLDAAFQLII